MKTPFQSIPGGVTAPRGFSVGATRCGLKSSGKAARTPRGDLAILASDVPAAAAGLFTTNLVKAAPVFLCLERLRKGRPQAQAVVVNSGNANACTGEVGTRDAREMAERTARLLGIDPALVLVASTGHIGVPLPMTLVRRGIRDAHAALAADETAAAAAAEAILTSDTRSKSLAVEVPTPDGTIRIGGMCKGAGMIQPGMTPDGRGPGGRPLHATMLAFLTTDAAISPTLLQKFLTEAVSGSFNGITVDGDMSTNDTVLMLANGRAGTARWTRADAPGADLFREALKHVCFELASMIVGDGEGVSRVVSVHVDGAASDADADRAARAVGNSPLVKTSWYGGSPNWGRVMDALGHSGALFDPVRVSIGYRADASAPVAWAVSDGIAARTSHARLHKVTTRPRFDLVIRLGDGPGNATVHAGDLTEGYIAINKDE